MSWLGLKVSVPHVTSSGDLEKKEGVCKCVCVCGCGALMAEEEQPQKRRGG